MKKKFEYKILRFKQYGILNFLLSIQEIEQQINQLGNEGWELISVVLSTSGFDTTMPQLLYTFKREI